MGNAGNKNDLGNGYEKHKTYYEPTDITEPPSKVNDSDSEQCGNVGSSLSGKKEKSFESAKNLFIQGNDLLKASLFQKARCKYFEALQDLKDLQRLKNREAVVPSKGAEIEQTTLGLSNLGAMEFAAGRYEEARKMLNQAIDFRNMAKECAAMEEDKDDIEDTSTKIDSLAALTIALSKDLTFHRIPDSQRVTKCVIQEHSSIDAITADILNNLGACNEVLGMVEPATGMYKESLNLRKVLFGENSLKAADVMQNLATILDSQGQLNEAVKLLEKALEIQNTISGESSVETAITTNNLGVVYAHIGDISKSEDFLRQSLHLREIYYGKDHQFTASARQNLQYVFNKKQALEHHTAKNVCIVEVGAAKSQDKEARSLGGFVAN